MTDEQSPQNVLEQLLQSYPDLLVYRDEHGFFDVYKQLAADKFRRIAVSTHHNLARDQGIRVVISGEDYTNEERARQQGVVYSITPENNPNTYLQITRPVGTTLDVEVIYPKDPGKRINPQELLNDSRHGLEVFNAFQHLDKDMRGKYTERVADDMSDIDPEQIGRMIENISQDIPDFGDFMSGFGLDPRLRVGEPRLAFMLIKQAIYIPITRETINGSIDW